MDAQFRDQVTTLLLCRHGETDWNRAGLIVGQRDVPLNETGRRQAVALGERLSDHDVAAVFSSDLRRARDTAALAFPGRPIRLDLRLREADLGRATGLTREEYRELDGGRWWQSVTENPETAPNPGGEAFGAVRARVVAALFDIARAYPGATVAVLSHGTALELAMTALLGLPLTEATRFHFGNGECRFVAIPVRGGDGG